MIYVENYQKEIQNFSNKVDLSLFKNKSILITGGTGLIGSYLIDSLLINKDFPVQIYATATNIENSKKRFSIFENDKRLNFINYDLSKNEQLNINTKIDYVIHLASFVSPKLYASNPVETMTINFIGCYNLLKFAKNNGCEKFFFASSSEIYGTSMDEMTESNVGKVDCADVRSCYNESKRATETLCYSFEKEYALPVYVGRFCRIYGPTAKSDDNKVLSQFIKNALNNQDIVLKSKGEQLFSYLYVSDAVAGIIQILNKGTSSTPYNISSDKDVISLKEIAELISSFNNKQVIFNLPSEAEQASYSKAINSILIADKLRELGWNEQYTMKDGLLNTYNLFKEIYYNN